MAYDIFMQIDGIEGDSHDKDHPGWIRLYGFHHRVAQADAVAAGGHGDLAAARAHHDDIVIHKYLDKASVPMYLACCQGKSIGQVKIAFCASQQLRQTFLEYTLKDVVIWSLRSYLQPFPSASFENSPAEEVALRYATIEWVYTDLESGGGKPMSHFWDVLQNRGG